MLHEELTNRIIGAVRTLEPAFTAQVLTYLRLSGLRVGLIVNFDVEALRFGVKRIVL
jgi:GxxExxY protein